MGNLNVVGMLRNRRLAYQISGADFTEIRRRLAYKTRRPYATGIIANDRGCPASRPVLGTAR
ncbi:hypothetical protein ACFYPT_40360 [Streptomyces sp. NPDC005529]|uniref:hypothetical protein n=1 Tax=unclassified Streptomyces TaxID=2593676 RepID=UPI0033AA0809